MILHQASTQTITRYPISPEIASRRCAGAGPSSQTSASRPAAARSIAIFVWTPRARSEAAAMATMCINFDALPIGLLKGGAEARPPLMLADDRLCETYKAYRACVPDSKIEFEEMLLLGPGTGQR